jgi:hypothetical protein
MIVQELNRFLRGWAGYFRYGNSRRHFDQDQLYALERLACFVAKRHKRSDRGTAGGSSLVADRMGLIDLNGTVVAPDPTGPGVRAKPNAGGEERR